MAPQRRQTLARGLGHIAIILGLTILTQVGGIAWIAALLTRFRWPVFVVSYGCLLLATPVIAPLFGRVALSCWADGPLQMQSNFYCLTHRNYMDPEMLDLLEDAAQSVDTSFPGTETLVLDAGFPFLDGFPLLPHLSHDDGGQADLAFFYSDETGFLPGRTRSPIGYFAFEDGPTQCPRRWLSLRWDMAMLQPLWRGFSIETDRTAHLIRALAAHPSTGRLFVEPHMVESLGVSHPNIGFQGCRAARHDDHIHVQL